jgi:hypothetical protein
MGCGNTPRSEAKRWHEMADCHLTQIQYGSSMVADEYNAARDGLQMPAKGAGMSSIMKAWAIVAELRA